MKINISKADAMHVLNWLNAFKSMYNEPKTGMAYLVNGIDGVRKRIWDECKTSFSAKAKMVPANNNAISYMTGDDFWWIDKKYLTK